MAKFFTSDTHFGHHRIIELCARPFLDIYEMDWKLVDIWNSVVGVTDTVYHLGDVALGPWVRWHEILSALNGRKILIKGNHDRVFAGNKDKHIERFLPVYEQWFDEMYDVLDMELAGRRIRLSHFPYDGDSHGEDRYSEFRTLDDGVPLVHGHTHDGGNPISVSAQGTPQFHVGMDAWNYFPVHESHVIDWLETL